MSDGAEFSLRAELSFNKTSGGGKRASADAQVPGMQGRSSESHRGMWVFSKPVQ